MPLESIKSLNKLAQERQALVITVLVITSTLVFLIIYLINHHKVATIATVKSAANFVNPVANSSDAVWREQQETTLQQANRRSRTLQEKITTLNAVQTKEAQFIQEQQLELQSVLAKLQIIESHSAPAATGLQFPGENGNGGVNSTMVPGAKCQIAITHFPLTPASNYSAIYTSKNYIPAGSFIRAVMLSGLDAPTGVNNQAQPVPVLLRLTSWGNLPNNATSHIKSCFMTAAGIGDISAERAYVRTERMSCTLTNQHVIDLPVEATVVGPDGKDGVRGPVVWRETAMIQRAAAAGLLSGFSNALAQTYTVQSSTPFGTTTSVNNKQIMEYGLANGAANGMNELADYFISERRVSTRR